MGSCVSCASNDILNASLRGTPRFRPFPPGAVLVAKVVKVYDGDTITVALHHGGVPWLFQVRLRGVDTPELRGGGDAEKRAARDARAFVSARIANKIVSIHIDDKIDAPGDKYGRLLARVVTGAGEDVAALLIERGLGVPYTGGEKIDWGAFRNNSG